MRTMVSGEVLVVMAMMVLLVGVLLGRADLRESVWSATPNGGLDGRDGGRRPKDGGPTRRVISA